MHKYLLALFVLATTTSARADMVFFDLNSNLEPAPNDIFTINEAGFAFTPTSNVALSGLRTKFSGTFANKTVFVELFNSVGGMPVTAVTLLSESFTAMSGPNLQGVDFTPFNLIAGMEYFISLREIAGVGVNFTSDNGQAPPLYGEVRYTSGTAGRFDGAAVSPPQNQPIVQLLTPAPVPEPSTTVLLALCGAVGGGISLRKRRAAMN